MEEFIKKVLGKPYHLHNFNCWTLVALYYSHLNKTLPLYSINSTNPREITRVFTEALLENKHGFVQTQNPKDGDVILFKSPIQMHVGLYYKGKVLHQSPKCLGVSLQSIKDVIGFKKVEYWKYDTDKTD